MRVLVFGASGMLGKDLMAAFPDDEVSGMGSRDADLKDPISVLAAVQRAQPDWIILSAAYTDVDGCEKDPAKAFAVNRDGAANVAKAATQTGARLIFLSSDYVFDGEKRTPYEVEDARNPINLYGRSKAEAECQLLELDPTFCIVRTSWLFGAGGKCFPDTMLNLAKTQPELRVVNDQRGGPTYTSDLAGAIASLVRERASGIVHATNHGNCSWFEFASAILAARSAQTRVVPVSSAEFPRAAQRPAYSVLSGRSLEKFGIKLPDWRDALTRYLDQRAD
jgi:dTDP-4-dehydrorhamnose reductase